MALDAKINAILPPRYQHCYDGVNPVSMGSAGLKYGADGKVAWDEVWTSFCDLALAGGPPHRGKLLVPAPPEEITAEPEKYQQVVEEIGRGIWMVTGLHVLPRFAPGWIGVVCRGTAMAPWLVRAIVVENILARQDRHLLLVPAGPRYHLAKEIKNVVTAVAKTCHYWNDHLPEHQQQAIADLLGPMNGATSGGPATTAEVSAAPDRYRIVVAGIEQGIRQATGLSTVPSFEVGWVGVPCTDAEMAIWLMRAVIAHGIVARREAGVLYLPASPRHGEAEIEAVVRALSGAHRLWGMRCAAKQHGAAAKSTPR
ncbi:MAG: hypothetical protein K2R98_11585 [Gemmataceae bacterium]|nr:hypothetical protein [Gemmataceae bacterium]